MRRNALQTFFARALLVGLPLIAGCHFHCPEHVVAVVVDNTEGFGDGGVLDDKDCAKLCYDEAQIYQAATCTPLDGGTSSGADGGSAHQQYLCRGDEICVGGRRPEGFAAAANTTGLEHMAALELASVHAFRILGDELRAHGAPVALVAAAHRSARDEARHARLVGELAGCRPSVKKPTRRARTLEEIAIENMREGCVRETFGAATLAIEARTHADPARRRVMAALVPDEERHAELAFAVDAWLRPQLSTAARTRVIAARDTALAELRDAAPDLRPLLDELATLLAA